MDEKPDQIINHIEAQRDELGRNLNELETRVRATTDWRTYFDKNPGLAVGAALGGGILLGFMVNSKRHSSPAKSGAIRPWDSSHSSHSSSSSSAPSSSSSSSHSGTSAGASAGAAAGATAMGLSSSGSQRRSSLVSSPVTSQQFKQVSETLDHVKAALIAFGIAKAKEFVSQAIPGLDQHLSEAEQRGRQHSSGPSSSQTWQQESTSPGSAGGDRSHSWQSAGAHQPEPSPVSF